MRLALIFSLASLAGSPMSFAADASCSCSDQCMTQCQNGNSKDCKCKSCDCAKYGQCSHDKCHNKDKDKK